MDPIHIRILSDWILRDSNRDPMKFADLLKMYPALGKEDKHTVSSAALTKLYPCEEN